MEPMKQCPQCGKYVAADRTYCMNCGVTLGVRCPACRAVSPVGSRTCAECGHSFVQKKKHLNIPLWNILKQNAKSVLGGGIGLILLFSLITAGFPAVELRQLVLGHETMVHDVSGYELMRYFLSGKPDSITALLSLRDLEDALSAVKALLFGAGVGWLLLIVGLAFAVCLPACNYKRMGKTTARRLFAPLGVALGGAVLLYSVTPILGHVLRDALTPKPPVEGMTFDTMSLCPLLVLIAVAMLFLLQTVLYVGVFHHKEDSEEELSLSRILYIPLSYVGRGYRTLRRRIRRKKSGESYVERDEPTFTVTPRFTTYIILFIGSLVFTQALLSKISHIFFWFVFLLPLVLLVYVLLSKNALSVDMLCETVTTEKNTPYTYEFRIDNRSILALPFIEALVSLPQSNSVRCTERVVRLSMAPLTAYHMKNTVSFRFRGTYDIGVKCFYIYDFFRLFRVRVDMENISTVYVMPRRLSPDDTLAQAVSDSTVRTVRSPLVVDKLEVSDIRDYQNGDSLKSIHWKLSSKAENFVVKDYNTGTAAETVVFCDMYPHFPDEPPKKADTSEGTDESSNKRNRRNTRQASGRKARREQDRKNADLRAKNKRVKETRDTHAISDEELQKRLDERAAVSTRGVKDASATESVPMPALPITEEAVDVHELAQPRFYEDMNEYLADGVVELSIAMVLSELRQGHDVLLLWFDRRSDTGVFAYSLRGADEFENIYHLFATAPLCEPDQTGSKVSHSVTSLTAMVSQLQSVKQLFVIPSLEPELLSELTSLPSVADAGNAGSTEVVLYTPEERFKYPRERSSYLEGCREQLSAHGISLTAGSYGINDPVKSTSPHATPTEGGNHHG